MQNIFSSRPGSGAPTPTATPKGSVDPPPVLNNGASMARLLSRVESSKAKANARTSNLNHTLKSSTTGEANQQMFARVKVAPLPWASVGPPLVTAGQAHRE